MRQAEMRERCFHPNGTFEMDRLPVIGIGKVDRQRLPAPGRARPALAEPYAAPPTPVEQEVACIWADVLDRDEVDVDDLFVDGDRHRAEPRRRR